MAVAGRQGSIISYHRDENQLDMLQGKADRPWLKGLPLKASTVQSRADLWAAELFIRSPMWTLGAGSCDHEDFDCLQAQEIYPLTAVAGEA